ncbi:class I SAM-dependent methyltransferase [Dyadobacter fermentans]|uniref:SAM-dependent methyltransferase n=1 Tax=Dyadobacter fermentans (strain ATCC 700827 / DSM 18053 / CIP 107007 / KCTC 52180 / NS114) TaxID=471854 RepID=C6VZ71_DYAFD|nr:methyltransferase [Dyadobacter fermentans]ACT91683.1 SAM-dependent methyltransferase [Dyadobacter fermentans DSM 18053]
MNVTEKAREFISETSDSLHNGTFVKLSLGNYRGPDDTLKNIYIKPILIKKEPRLSLTYRHKTRDIAKNHTFEEVEQMLLQWLGNDFRVATLQTVNSDTLFEMHPSGKATLKKKAVSGREAPSLSHDKAKNRLIAPAEKGYLFDLKITDQQGNVFHNAQDKFRQINHYIDILSSLIREIGPGRQVRVADMGSGKGYLTFALYDYLRNVLQLDPQVTGIEFRNDLVTLCNEIARKAGFEGLSFREGTIDQFDAAGTNILIALHACDTATDDAIFKGIQAESDLIVVAPCCHKQIRRQIEQHKAENDVSFLTRHGIFLERQAEMVTDGIRALVLEYFGYKTKVFEFISDAHTPKNVLIVGTKGNRSEKSQAAALEKIREAKQFFGIEYHHLERLAGI